MCTNTKHIPSVKAIIKKFNCSKIKDASFSSYIHGISALYNVKDEDFGYYKQSKFMKKIIEECGDEMIADITIKKDKNLWTKFLEIFI